MQSTKHVLHANNTTARLGTYIASEWRSSLCQCALLPAWRPHIRIPQTRTNQTVIESKHVTVWHSDTKPACVYMYILHNDPKYCNTLNYIADTKHLFFVWNRETKSGLVMNNSFSECSNDNLYLHVKYLAIKIPRVVIHFRPTVRKCGVWIFIGICDVAY